MVRRIQSCIGFDEDNIEWLREQGVSMSDWINRAVQAYRNDEKVRKTMDASKPLEKAEIKFDAIRKRDEEDAIKIRAYLLDNQHIMYMAKTQRKFTKRDLCKIKDELFYSKYNLETNVDVIKIVLREEMLKFDVAKYEEERGIIKKV